MNRSGRGFQTSGSPCLLSASGRRCLPPYITLDRTQGNSTGTSGEELPLPGLCKGRAMAHSRRNFGFVQVGSHDRTVVCRAVPVSIVFGSAAEPKLKSTSKPRARSLRFRGGHGKFIPPAEALRRAAKKADSMMPVRREAQSVKKIAMFNKMTSVQWYEKLTLSFARAPVFPGKEASGGPRVEIALQRSCEVTPARPTATGPRIAVESLDARV